MTALAPSSAGCCCGLTKAKKKKRSLSNSLKVTRPLGGFCYGCGTFVHIDLLLSDLALSGAEDDSHAESDKAVWEDFLELWEDTERAPLFLSHGGSSVEQMSRYSSWALDRGHHFILDSESRDETMMGWGLTFTDEGAISGGDSSSKPNARRLSARTSA